MGAADLGLRVENLDKTARRRLNTEAATTGFCETREVVFTAPGELEGDLFIDDERLSRDGSENRWKWRPGFYAGEVRAEFVDPAGQSLGVFRLDVSPDPNKVGRETFERMLGEIAGFDPRLLEGREPARHPLGPLGEESNPVVAFVRLRRREDAIRRALADIRAQPIRGLRARRDLVPLTRMRRVDHRTVRRALSRPSTAALVLGQDSSDREVVPAGMDPNPQFDIPSVERQLDTPPNRAALAMLLALSRRCSDVAKRLRPLEHAKTADAASGLSERVPRWIGILERFRRDLERTRRAMPFSAVKRPGFSAAGLNAIASHPLYARFYRLGWEALRRGVSDLGPEDPLPLSPTWEIYERWCFVELAGLLRRSLPDFSWSPAGKGDRLEWRGRRADGRVQVVLFLQQTASSTNGKPKSNALWSVSKECRPDLVLRWTEEGGCSAFVVFDAKYRAARDRILAGMMESAHPYQNALRWADERSSATLLLVPDAKEVPWLSRLEFVREHRVGVLTLRPGAGLPSWLRDLLTRPPVGFDPFPPTGTAGPYPAGTGRSSYPR